jgi:hypothetical protein
LTLPYLYQDLELHTASDIVKIASLLHRNPHLGKTIRTLSYRPTRLDVAEFATLGLQSINWEVESTKLATAWSAQGAGAPDNASAIQELFERSQYFQHVQSREAYTSGSAPVAQDVPDMEYKARLACCRLALEFIFLRTDNLLKLTHILPPVQEIPPYRSLVSRTGSQPTDSEDVALPTWRQIMSLGSGEIQTLDLRLSPRADFNPEDVDFSRFPKLRQLSFYSVSGGRHTEAASLVYASHTIAPVALPLEKIICQECPPSHQHHQYGSTSFATVFLDKLQLVLLPSLTSLELHDGQVCSPWRPFTDALANFLGKHGRNLRYINVDTMTPDWHMFDSCPKLEHLILQVTLFRARKEFTCDTASLS